MNHNEAGTKPAIMRAAIVSALPARFWRGFAVGLSLLIGLLAAMAGWYGMRSTASAIAAGARALPATLSINLIQLGWAGLAWAALLPGSIPLRAVFRARWVREAINAIFPVASLGGSIVATRMLARTSGVSVALIGASAAADITGEAIAQFAFLLTAVALASTLPHAPFHPAWIAGLVLFGALALIGAQFAGIIGWIERLVVRIAPARIASALNGLERKLMMIYREPARMARNIGWNLVSWSLGAVEAWLLLRVLGSPVAWRVALVVEGFGVVSRSLGFALPAGIGAQEAGFVLSASLFGVPHEAALAMSALKRVRELILGLVGIGIWQWSEWHPRLRAG